MSELGTHSLERPLERPLERRLERVSRRAVYPVYRNKWEPELVSLHWTKAGATAKVEHLIGPWCGVEDCYHDPSGGKHVWVGPSVEVEA